MKATAHTHPLRLVKADHVFKFSKPKCPYCGGNLFAEADGWTQQIDGSWAADSLSIDCDAEPNIDGPHWPGWWESHSYDYCAEWQVLHDRLLRWLGKRVRFDLENKPASPTSERTLKGERT